MKRGGYFADRQEAGRRLAEALGPFRDRNPLVLALPRGGVPVGYEIAAALDCPLDVIMVRKIGAPQQPELAAAAVVDGERPETVRNDRVIDMLGITDGYLEDETARQLAEIERRRSLYLSGRPRPSLKGVTALLVDDGIATGSTIRAAAHGVARAGPASVVIAVPVAPPDTVDILRNEVDDVVCLETPAGFGAIGAFYTDFHQVSDDEVIDCLRKAADLLEPETNDRSA